MMNEKVSTLEELAYRRAALVAGRAAVEMLHRHDPDAGPLQVQLARRAIERPILDLITTRAGRDLDQDDKPASGEEIEADALQQLLDRVLLQIAINGAEWCFPFRSIARETGLPIEIVRALCRELRSRGLAYYSSGLFSEDGETAGSGYGVTREGLDEARLIEARSQVRRRQASAEQSS